MVQSAFEDPSWRSNPRMPLMNELVELFWKAYEGRAIAEEEELVDNRLGNGGAYASDANVAQHR